MYTQRERLLVPAKDLEGVSFIPASEFDFKPAHTRSYSSFERVTRQNFASWIYQSFAEARGNLLLQLDYIRLTSLHTQMDVHQTMRNFAYDRDGVYMPWGRLSVEEQQAIIRGYDKLLHTRVENVRLVERPFHGGEFVHKPINIQQRFDKQIDSVILRLKAGTGSLITIYNGMTIPEFRESAEAKLKVFRY